MTRTTDDVATLAKAIEWASARWLERPVPLRLTVHDTEGELGGLAFSPAFERTLGAKAHDTMLSVEQVTCYHVGHPVGVSLFECRDCHGSGQQTVRRWRYRFPMWNALARLDHARNATPRHPHPSVLIGALADNGWSVERAAAEIERPVEVAEALFLVALRKLHGRYEAGPVDTRRVPYTERSESQRNAEAAA